MRLFAVVAALLAALSFPASAHDTPEALLHALYAPYIAGEIPENQEALFSENLLALYAADAARTPAGEMGAIEFDPFVNGQDFEITAFETVDLQVDGDAAVAEVRFSNMGTVQELLYSLVKEEDGWKVDDVQSLSGEFPYRLTDIFLEAQGN